jgi:hypothetical protein
VWRCYHVTAVDIAALESIPSADDSALVDGGPNTEKIMVDIDETPKAFMLHAGYPNPFNSTSIIKYDLPEDANVRLALFNTLGQEVVRLTDGFENAGFKSATFDATLLPSGVYFYRMMATSAQSAQSYSNVRKMMLVR